VKQPATPLPYQVSHVSDGWVAAKPTDGKGTILKTELIQDAEYIIHACNAYPQLIGNQKRLVGALQGIFKAMDDGLLVRDTSRDHESDWAIKQLSLVQVPKPSPLSIKVRMMPNLKQLEASERACRSYEGYDDYELISLFERRVEKCGNRWQAAKEMIEVLNKEMTT